MTKILAALALVALTVTPVSAETVRTMIKKAGERLAVHVMCGGEHQSW